MTEQHPMLMESPLTKRVFIVTRYKDNGDGTFTASKKYDITDQFEALAKQRSEILYGREQIDALEKKWGKEDNQ